MKKKIFIVIALIVIISIGIFALVFTNKISKENDDKDSSSKMSRNENKDVNIDNNENTKEEGSLNTSSDNNMQLLSSVAKVRRLRNL